MRVYARLVFLPSGLAVSLALALRKHPADGIDSGGENKATARQGCDRDARKKC